MGGSESVIRNVDKRTSRRENAAHFKEAIDRFREENCSVPPVRAPPPTVQNGIRVCVRKRPIFPHETKKNDYDVVTCIPRTGGTAQIAVHDARMAPDMINMFMNHHIFDYDSVFSEKATNDDVYLETAKPLVDGVLEANINATVMMYGQTGSGKTYTMTALQERVFHDLFTAGSSDVEISVSFVELAGDRCSDMLNSGQSVSLTSAADGSMQPYPCVEVEVQSAKELISLVNLANSLRATAATGVHDQSSRSHAVCRVFVRKNGKESQLTLVDLAGSEHRIDSDEHNAERRKEGAMINASLAALKDCIRAKAAGAQFIGYRNNRLTQILRGCFTDSATHPHTTVVIATVSPSSKDTEHSLNTLRHACVMDGQGTGHAAGSSHLVGGKTVKEDLGALDVAAMGRKKFLERQKRKHQPPPQQTPPIKQAPAHQQKQSNMVAREALDRKGVAALPPRIAEALQRARDPEYMRSHPGQRGRLLQGGGAVARKPAGGRRSSSTGASRKPPPKPTWEDDYGDECLAATTVERGMHGSHGGAGRMAAPLPASPPPPYPGPEMSSPPSDASQSAEAFRLWKLFVSNGKESRCWRKNDLRLISLYVLPTLPASVFPTPSGYTANSFPWNRVELALDDLEGILRKLDEPASSAPAPAPASRCWKLEAAKARREAIDQQRREHVEAKVLRNPSAPPSDGQLEKEIAELEERIALGGSAATLHGWKRQIEMKKAALMKRRSPAADYEAARVADRSPSSNFASSGEIEPLGGPPRPRATQGKRIMGRGSSGSHSPPSSFTPPQQQSPPRRETFADAPLGYNDIPGPKPTPSASRPKGKRRFDSVPGTAAASIPNAATRSDSYDSLNNSRSGPKYGRRVAAPVGAASAPFGNAFTDPEYD